jgi:hypothetical protein
VDERGERGGVHGWKKKMIRLLKSVLAFL